MVVTTFGRIDLSVDFWLVKPWVVWILIFSVREGEFEIWLVRNRHHPLHNLAEPVWKWVVSLNLGWLVIDFSLNFLMVILTHSYPDPFRNIEHADDGGSNLSNWNLLFCCNAGKRGDDSKPWKTYCKVSNLLLGTYLVITDLCRVSRIPEYLHQKQ